MVKDGQVRKLFRDLESEAYLAVAARRAGMDEKTARKYRSLGALPSTQRRPRTYRTRTDPLAELWRLAQERLEAEPRLRAKALFDWLQKEHPGRLTGHQRRTFERRVRHWRATAGRGRTVMFSQVQRCSALRRRKDPRPIIRAIGEPHDWPRRARRGSQANFGRNGVLHPFS
jgi:hypothetical protein